MATSGQTGASIDPALDQQQFGLVRKGFDPEEVRAFLRRVGGELRSLQIEIAERERGSEIIRRELTAVQARVAELEEAKEQRPPTGPLDEATVVAAVGEQMAELLRSAHSTAQDLRTKAASEAKRITDDATNRTQAALERAERALAEATAKADLAAEEIVAAASAKAEALTSGAEEAAESLRARATEEAETLTSTSTEEAERRLARARAEADQRLARAAAEAQELVAKARTEAAGLKAEAEREHRSTVEGAQLARERILTDLARRRRIATVQIEQLRAGRERLLASYGVVRSTLEEVNLEFQRADAEARAAADEAGRRLAGELGIEPPEAAPDDPLGVGGDPGPEGPEAASGTDAGPAASGDAEPVAAGDPGHVVAGDREPVAPGAAEPAVTAGAPGAEPSTRGPDGADGASEPEAAAEPDAEAEVEAAVEADPASAPAAGGPEAAAPAAPEAARGAEAVGGAGEPRPGEAGAPGPGRTSATTEPTTAESGGEVVAAAGADGTAGAGAHGPGAVPTPEPGFAEPPSAPAVDAGPRAAAPTRGPLLAEAPAPRSIRTIATQHGPAGDEPPGLRMVAGGHAVAAPQHEAATVLVAVAEPQPVPDPAAASAESAPTATDAVTGLFERIRAGREGSVAEARRVLDAEPEPAPGPAAAPSAQEPEPAAADPEGAGPAAAVAGPERPATGTQAITGEAILQRREEATTAVAHDLTRRLKRVLQDEQNDLLDRLRNAPTPYDAGAILPPAEQHAAAYAEAALPYLAAAAREGTAVSASLDPAAAEGDVEVGASSSALASELVGPLRRRLEEVIGEHRDDEDHEALAESFGSAYRDAKTRRIEAAAADATAAAFALGAWVAVPAGHSLQWVATAPEGPCADCEDNTLAGDVIQGEPFPTGQLHPPAHGGCRCVALPGGLA